MQVAPPAPTAQGSFAKTPFPHLLVYALERGLTGTFELLVGAQSVATILVIQGVPAKIRTTEGVLFLGDVMTELGLVSLEAVQASQARMAESPRLQGQILKELGAIDDARLELGLRAQLDRKIEHLFGLPAETVFSYFDGVDNLQRFGGPPTPIDPLPALWRGVRQQPAWEHVDATLRRVGTAALRISAGAQLERFQFTAVESGAIDILRQRPMRVIDIANARLVGPSVAQLLVYLLVITKQVDLIEAPSLRPPTPGQGAPPPPGSTGRLPPTSAPGASPMAPAPGAQAFARVQLQAKPIQRAPLVIEEAPVARNAADGRIASPLPQPIPPPDASAGQNASANVVIPQAPSAPIISGMDGISPEIQAPPAGLGLDIGAMISTTIQSSMPPPLLTADSSFASAPPPPGAPAGSIPPAAASSPSTSVVPPPPPSVPAPMSLTPEQAGLKQKILDRASQISAQDYFQMLSLERDATPEMVQKAFVALAKVWHPDRLPPALIDVKDACSKVFTHLTEAQATLCDADRRAEYMTLLKDGGATPDDQAKIHAILDAATEFQKAEICMKRNDTAQAHELVKRAYSLDPEQADYLALLTWLDAQKPEWIGREKTLEKVAVLDRCIKMNVNSERAYFYRGMLFKRIEETSKSIKDFKKAAELNPRNLDAMREVRLHNMRGGQSKPPPGMSSSSSSAGRSSQKPGQKPAQPETLGGLFGKLFKK